MITPFTGHERDSVPADINDPKQYVAMGVPYDSGALVFRRLLDLGLRDYHSVLDFGAGSLRVGRFLVTYLEPSRYYAIEPQSWLLDAGLNLMGRDIENIKKLRFDNNAVFNLNVFSPQRFEYILLSSILMHTSHAQMKAIFSTAVEALAPGGMIVADYRDGSKGKDYLGEEWAYPNLAWHQRSCLEGAFEGRWKYEELDRGLYGALWFKLT